ncbi:hypothetical protein VTL71DRAFT_12374 [Oculimacula yallundae]|uniref:GH16 domain-containing protein n=1 Tax=Oculimacula yallundae TaxID=86028 RepID=A0ABR4CMF8_9HELO
MLSLSLLLTLSTLLSTTTAFTPEPISGFHVSWADTFSSPDLSLDLTKWRRWTGQASNNEQQTYTATGSNCEITSSESLLITPLNNNGEWTSCRIESVPAFTTKAGSQMIVQARLKLGGDESAGKQMQGIWPAFWSLGEGVRTGTEWPACGEIDTFENINGDVLGHGTVHCGAACNDPVGLGSGMNFDYATWHTWAHAIDLRSAEWRDQSITWYLDGHAFKVLKGADVGDESAWAALVHRGMIVTLNVAIGGSWAGAAALDTVSGKAAGMEVGYVAVYESD